MSHYQIEDFQTIPGIYQIGIHQLTTEQMEGIASYYQQKVLLFETENAHSYPESLGVEEVEAWDSLCEELQHGYTEFDSTSWSMEELKILRERMMFTLGGV